MPLIARALTSIQAVKDELVGIGDAIPPEHDLWLESHLNAATDEVERYCRRTFLQQTYTNEFYVAAGGTRLPVRQWPLVSITSVDDSDDNGKTWTAVPAADYYAAPDLDLEAKWYIVRPDGWPDGRGALRGDTFTNRVTYVAGYVLTGSNRNLPYDVEVAVARILAAEYLQRGKQGLSTESFAGMTLNFHPDRWPLAAKITLRQYKKLVV